MHANVKAIVTSVRRDALGRIVWTVRLRTTDGRAHQWGGSRQTMESARHAVAERLYRIDLGLV